MWGQFTEIFGLFTVAAWLITIIVHAVFAVGVFADSSSLSRRRDGPIFASPFWWALATLVGGVVVAGVYWAMHHSILRPARRDQEEAGWLPDSTSGSRQTEAGH